MKRGRAPDCDAGEPSAARARPAAKKGKAAAPTEAADGPTPGRGEGAPTSGRGAGKAAAPPAAAGSDPTSARTGGLLSFFTPAAGPPPISSGGIKRPRVYVDAPVEDIPREFWAPASTKEREESAAAHSLSLATRRDGHVWLPALQGALAALVEERALLAAHARRPPASPPAPPAVEPATSLTLLRYANGEGSRLSAYTCHLLWLVHSVGVANAGTAALLSPEERALVAAILSLSAPAAGLLARMLSRRGPWMRASSFLKYPEVGIGGSVTLPGGVAPAPGPGPAGAGVGADAGAVGAGGQEGEASDAEEVEEGGEEGPRTAPRPSLAIPWPLVASSSHMRAVPPRTRPAPPPPGFHPAPAIVAALDEGARLGLLSVLPMTRGGPAKGSLESVTTHLQAVACVAHVVEIRTIMSRLAINTNGKGAVAVMAAAAAEAETRGLPSFFPRPPPGGAAEGAAAFSSVTTATTSRVGLLALLRHTMAAQRSVAGGRLPLEAAVGEALRMSGASKTGRATETDGLLVRLTPALASLLRRLHGLAYLVTGTAHLSSGTGTGVWPVGYGADEESRRWVSAGEKGGAEGGAVPCAEDIELELEAEEAGAGAVAGAGGEGEIVMLDSQGEELEEGGGGSESVPLRPVFGPPLPQDKWRPPSGSKYADTAASSDTFVKGGATGGFFSPGLMHVFHRLDFAPVTTSGGAWATPFTDRPSLRAFEVAHCMRAQVDATGVLGMATGEAFPGRELHAGKGPGVVVTACALPPAWRAVAANPPPPAKGEAHPTLPPFAAGLALLPHALALLGVSHRAHGAGAVLLAASPPHAARTAVALARMLRVTDIPAGPPVSPDAVGARPFLLLLRYTGLRACALVPPSAPAPTASSWQALQHSPPALLTAARASLCLALSEVRGVVGREGSPPHLAQLSPSSLYSTLLWEAIDPLERGKAHAFTLPFLAQLTGGSNLYTPHRSGRWWARLSLNLEHAGLVGDAARATGDGLGSPHVRAGDRILLLARQQRVTSRLGRLTSAGGARPTASPAPTEVVIEIGDESGEEEEEGAPPTDPHADMPFLAGITAAALAAGSPGAPTHPRPLSYDTFARMPLNRVRGERSAFVTGVDEDNDGEGEGAAPAPPLLLSPSPSREGQTEAEHANVTDAVCASFGVTFAPSGDYCYSGAGMAVGASDSRWGGASGELRISVESLCLQHYNSGAGGGWRGWHCEGGAVQALFALLMWDHGLFASGPHGPPCAFLTPYQDGPLDLDCPAAFYTARKGVIQARLTHLAGCTGAELITTVGAAWRAHYGQVARGLRWASQPLQLLQLVAVGLGGPGLACLCDAFCWDHKHLTGGMPDLLLWRVAVASGGGGEAAAAAPPAAAPPLPHPDLLLPPGAVVHARLVEVKGPRDVLSEKQHLWLRVLLAARIHAGLCKVTEPGAGAGNSGKRGGRAGTGPASAGAGAGGEVGESEAIEL